ncbi:PAS and ANTAR domain-containing protein [Isoptericola aurantiacus]|uniref:PAS and ANTAR domain-containing protein n=1 Tax=Isoptericola aurantiacus TaxID=3377839 RepID=UPI00383BE8A2
MASITPVPTTSTRGSDPFVVPREPGTGPITVEEFASGVAVGTGLLVGRYHVDLTAGRWWWSDEIWTMYGYRPGELEPGLDLLRRHQHAGERDRVIKDALHSLHSGRAFACSHRIVDAHGRNHCLLVTGQARSSGTGPSRIVGYVVDVTPVRQEAVEQQTRRAIDAAYVSAASIERAKGVLMAVHGIDEDRAEDILVRESGVTGAGLRDTAAQVISHLSRGDGLGDLAVDGLREAFAVVTPQRRPHIRDAHLARRRT